VFTLKLTNRQTTKSLHWETKGFSSSKKKNLPQFIEVYCSLQCSQQQANCNYPEPVKLTQPPPTLYSYDPINTTPTFNPSMWYLNFRFPHQNSACIYLLSHAFRMPGPSRRNYICSAVQTIKLFPHRVVSPSLSLPRTFLSTLFSISLQASRDTVTTEGRTRTTAMNRIIVDQLLASL